MVPQRSGVLEQVWNQEDVWPVIGCKAFILEWAFMLQSKVRAEPEPPNPFSTLYSPPDPPPLTCGPPPDLWPPP